jgi:hypothetical protein
VVNRLGAVACARGTLLILGLKIKASSNPSRVVSAKARAPHRQRQSTQPSRQSARLARSRSGTEAVEPTVVEQAEMRAAARNLDSGTRPTSRPPPSVPPPYGSRFSVLSTASLDHLGEMASDCGVIFRGERGPRVEQLAAIQAKEVYDGVLAASRAQLEHEWATTATPTDPVQLAPGSGPEASNGTNPLEGSAAAPQLGGRVGDLLGPRTDPRRVVGLVRFPIGEPPNLMISNECSLLFTYLEHQGV